MRPPPSSLFLKSSKPPPVQQLPRKIVFGSKPIAVIPEPPPQPKHFPEETIKKILLLEEFFHNKSLTLQATNDLIGAYVEGVEHFDRREPNIRYYYLEKIQFVLSRPEVINVLSGTEPNKTRDTLMNLRDTLRGTMMSPSQTTMVNPVFATNEKFDKDKHTEYNDEQKKKERSIKAQMYVDVQQEMKEKGPQLRAEYVKLEKTEQDVMNLISNQHNDLERRREQRRLKKKKRNSIDKLKMEEMQETQPQIQLIDLKQMQKDVHDQIIRFTIRQTSRQMELNTAQTNGDGDAQKKQEVQVQERPEIRETSRGGRIKIKNDDDDD